MLNKVLTEIRIFEGKIKNLYLGTSVAVQWFRLHAPMPPLQVQCMVGELRSHRTPSTAKKEKNQNCMCLHNFRYYHML